MSSSSTFPALERFIDNHQWIMECIQDKKTESFPYRPEKGSTEVSTKPFYPEKPPQVQLNTLKDKEPLFLINTPMNSGEEEDIHSFLTQLKNEGFADNAEESLKQLQKRVVVVIGCNCFGSIDKDITRSFKKQVKKITPQKGINYHCFGFFWEPKWVSNNNKSRLHSPKKAFFLLKNLSAESAHRVRTTFETSQDFDVPYQAIRERIKVHKKTRDLLDQMVAQCPSSPIYLTLLDSDAVSYRGDKDKPGVFSQMVTNIKKKNKHPSIVTPGYRLSNQEHTTIRVGVEMDMAVRTAIAKAGLIPYIPEPCSAFKIRKPGENPVSTLKQPTFIGNGHGLESRRLMNSDRGLFNDGVLFFNSPSLITQTPLRMYKDSTTKNVGYKRKSFLQAVRGLSQTHVVPRKFGRNVYAGLKQSFSDFTKVSTAIGTIFSIYDPISRMFVCSRFSKKQFDQVLQNHSTQNLKKTDKELLEEKREELKGIGMDEETLQKIEKAARLSSAALTRYLKDLTQGDG